MPLAAKKSTIWPTDIRYWSRVSGDRCMSTEGAVEGAHQLAQLARPGRQPGWGSGCAASGRWETSVRCHVVRLCAVRAVCTHAQLGRSSSVFAGQATLFRALSSAG